METPTPQPITRDGQHDGYIDIPVPQARMMARGASSVNNFTIELFEQGVTRDFIITAVGWYRNDFQHQEIAQGSLLVSLTFLAVGLLMAISQKARQ